MKRPTALAIGIAATLATTALWHGPGGAGDRLASRIEQAMRMTLDHYEMQPVTARLQRGPLSRRMLFNGPADDFQRSEIQRIAFELPIASARWVDRPAPSRSLPLLAEAMLMALVCFAVGVILSYVAALRRRALETFE